MTSRPRKIPSSYNVNIPSSWNIRKLREELSKLNIAAPVSSKKAELVKLYNTAIAKAGQESNALTNSESDNGGHLSVILSELSKLREVNDLRQAQANRSTYIPSAAGSPDQVQVLLPSGSSSDNTLTSAYVSLDGCISANGSHGNHVRTRYGFSQESFPFIETIPPKLRQSNVEGKDVNLANLIMPTIPSLNETDDGKGKSKPDPRLARMLTIEEFISAFGIYINIMCEHFPQRRVELDLYERDIVDMSTRYGGTAFYEYHKQFSARAAAHLKFNNIPVDWSIRNNTLFCNIFANQRPITCNKCSSITHTTGFCPLFGQNSIQSSQGKPSFESQNAKTDSYGRTRIRYGEFEICNNFNTEKGCVRPKCNNLHVCTICKKDHPKFKCSEAKNGNPP